MKKTSRSSAKKIQQIGASETTKTCQQVITDNYALYNGDSCEIIKGIKSDSIHYTIYSPPFSAIYLYSNSLRDMANCKTFDDFFAHFEVLVPELMRVTMPGRLHSFHCMNLPTSKSIQGYIGIRDFRGIMIRLFEKYGWIYHSEVCIWKDPVCAMQRTKSIGLLYKQLKKDSCVSRQGMADYIVTMQKPGDNPEPVTKKGDRKKVAEDDFTIDMWQQYASPVWMDINPSTTLQKFREEKDEKHIAPLQLQVIERCIRLWTNKGDTVFTPFLGIGSEAYQAVVMGRRGIGIELKKSYFDIACSNLKKAVAEIEQGNLFAEIDKKKKKHA